MHLVCYDVKVKEKVERSVRVWNQFGEQELEIKDKVRRLCVPSDKKVIQ